MSGKEEGRVKRAIAVVDANFGDSGKGLLTDFLCHRQAYKVIERDAVLAR